jgi:hypothetical protein
VRKRTLYLFVLGLAIVVMAGLTCAGFVVSAQNMNMTANTESKPKPKHRKKAAPSKGRCDNTKQEQTDLSGTYTGKLTHGDQPTMDATVTISGNNITVNAGSETHSGTIVTETTCGYTAVAIVMTGGGPGAPIDAASLRAKKVGDKLTLTSVPGEPKKIMFTTGGGMTKPKPRKHKAKAKSATTTTPAPKQ